VHEGHRERVRNRYLKEGLNSFEDHQILELLLYYAIPRKDTNPPAHQLLTKYGSLKNVLEADIHDLEKIDGIGKNAAAFLNMLLPVFMRYKEQKSGNYIILKNAHDAARYVSSLLEKERTEVMLVICLDKHFRVRHTERISSGAVDELTVYPRHVAEVAMRHTSFAILLTHNHPGGDPRPSNVDIETTAAIHSALNALGIPLIDHIIVSEGMATSMASAGLIMIGHAKHGKYIEETKQILNKDSAITIMKIND
jgi:DNA repair protein RadC